MKKFILIFLLSTIGIFSVDSQNRTPKRDGNFEWVLVESNGNQGAETTDGKTLLPLKFKSVLFLNGYFQTWNPNGAALYNRWGECLIPETRNYQAISVTKGLAKAQYSLGIYYIKEDGTKIKEGYDLLKKAADQAYAPAIELLKTLQQ